MCLVTQRWRSISGVITGRLYVDIVAAIWPLPSSLSSAAAELVVGRHVVRPLSLALPAHSHQNVSGRKLTALCRGYM